MKVAEIFTSINGEGERAGQVAVFVRFQGCNLKCSYCDTMWANDPDTPCTDMDVEEIARAVLGTGIHNVTLTGGEPLLQPDIGTLMQRLLSEPSLSVEIETNGSMPIKEFINLVDGRRPIFTLDYKLFGSGMERKMLAENYEYLTKDDTVKFVCSNYVDLCRSMEVMMDYQLLERCHVHLSPVFGEMDPAKMADFMVQHKLNGVTLQLQIHKVIWEPDRKGV